MEAGSFLSTWVFTPPQWFFLNYYSIGFFNFRVVLLPVVVMMIIRSTSSKVVWRCARTRWTDMMVRICFFDYNHRVTFGRCGTLLIESWWNWPVCFIWRCVIVISFRLSSEIKNGSMISRAFKHSKVLLWCLLPWRVVGGHLVACLYHQTSLPAAGRHRHPHEPWIWSLRAKKEKNSIHKWIFYWLLTKKKKSPL